MFSLTTQQRAFFEAFGFLLLRGLFRDDVSRLQEGFEEVFSREQPQPLDPKNRYHHAEDPRYAEQPRWIVPGFIDKSEKLSWIRDDERTVAIASGLLGDYVYAESDGNVFNCDVYWHLDAFGAAAQHQHVKLFFYLQRLRHEAGALRVIPGSHHRGPYTKALRSRLTAEPKAVPEQIGVATDEVPSFTLEVDPGDVVVSDFRTIHASFNGGAQRRLFTVNFRSSARETR